MKSPKRGPKLSEVLDRRRKALAAIDARRIEPVEAVDFPRGDEGRLLRAALNVIREESENAEHGRKFRAGRKKRTDSSLKKLVRGVLKDHKPSDLWRFFLKTQPKGFTFSGDPNTDEASVWMDKEGKADNYRRFSNIVNEVRRERKGE